MSLNEDLTGFLDYREEPVFTSPSPGARVEVPLEMIAAIATGLEEPLAIAKRHGFDEESFGALCQWPPFVSAVEQKKAEYAANGYTFRLKAGMMAESLVDHLYVLALGNEATFMQKLEAAKFLTKMGDLEPKTNQQAVQGEKFSIVINMPAQIGPQKVTLDAETVQNEVPTIQIP